MRKSQCHWFLVAAALVVSGCRLANVGKDYPEEQQKVGQSDAAGSKPPVVQPQKQAAAGSVLNISFDANGELVEKLTLRLDYFPAPRPDGVSVPTCYDELAGHLVVGRILCSSNGNLALDITAQQVQQKCYTSNPARSVEAKAKVVVAGCVGAASLTTVRYEPDIKLEVTRP